MDEIENRLDRISRAYDRDINYFFHMLWEDAGRGRMWDDWR